MLNIILQNGSGETQPPNVSKSLPIVIVNLRFLKHPQKRSCGNQLIHRSISKTKLMGSGSDSESQVGRQAGRQSDGYGGWCLELRWGGT